jgi:cytochrome c2
MTENLNLLINTWRVNMSRSKILRGIIVSTLLGGLSLGQAALALHGEPECDLETVIAHQQEHALELEDFHHQAETDLDAALATLYRTAIAYQALAIECGFANTTQVEAEHAAEHGGEVVVHDEHDAAAHLEIALSIGDPENGKVLFNTFRPEVSFACATCHHVDKIEQLVGPGLLGVSSPEHDHSAHTDEATTDTGMAGMAGMAETEEAHGHDEPHEATAEATPAAERTMEETVAYLHTAIVDPSAFVVPNYPDDLMPKVYGEIFTEQEINDLVAYLLTL